MPPQQSMPSLIPGDRQCRIYTVSNDGRTVDRTSARNLLKDALSGEHTGTQGERFLKRTLAVGIHRELGDSIRSLRAPKDEDETVESWLARLVGRSVATESPVELVRLGCEVLFRCAHSDLRMLEAEPLSDDVAPFAMACRAIGRQRPERPELELEFATGELTSVRLSRSPDMAAVRSGEVMEPFSSILHRLPWTPSHGEPHFLAALDGMAVSVIPGPQRAGRRSVVRSLFAPGLMIERIGDNEFMWSVGWHNQTLEPGEFRSLLENSPWTNYAVLFVEVDSPLDGTNAGGAARLGSVPADSAPQGYVLASYIHPVLRNIVGLIGDDFFGTARRDQFLSELSRLGPWLLCVLDPVYLVEEMPIPTACLGYVRRRPARLEIAFGVAYSLSSAPLSPDDEPEALVAWRGENVEGLVRDRSAEAELLSGVAKRWGFSVGVGRWSVGLEGEELISEVLNRTPPGELSVMWEPGQTLAARRLEGSKLCMSVRTLREYLTVDGVYQHSEVRLPLRALLTQIRNRRRFFAAEDGSWYEISERLFEQLGTLAAGTREASNAELRLAPWATTALAELEADGAQLDGARELRLPLAERIREASAIKVEIPQGVVSELREYQKAGVEWLARTAHWGQGALLADDMGLGKTIQALTFAALRRERGPSLVVASPTLLDNWVREAAKHMPGVFRVSVVHSSRGRTAVGFPLPGELVVTTYDRLRMDTESFAAVSWGTVLLDEAHELRNEKTQRHRAVHEILAGSRDKAFVLAITGTPIQNRPADAYSLFSLIAPGYLGERIAFLSHFDGNDGGLEAIRSAIRPFYLRRRKNDVAPELPPKVEVRRLVELDEDERRRYEDLRLAALQALDESAKLGNRMQVFNLIQRLRQFACDIRLVEPAFPGVGTKTAVIMGTVLGLLEEERPALVFSQFTSYLDILQKELTNRSVRFARLDGAMSPAERDRAVRSFQGGEKDVFLISLKAGGTGLNLTRAADVVLADPWWNEAAEQQAADRAHRIGQDRTVVVHKFVVRDTVEERVVAVSREKQGLIERVIEGEVVQRPPSLDELRHLLEGTGN